MKTEKKPRLVSQIMKKNLKPLKITTNISSSPSSGSPTPGVNPNEEKTKAIIPDPVEESKEEILKTEEQEDSEPIIVRKKPRIAKKNPFVAIPDLLDQSDLFLLSEISQEEAKEIK